MDNFILAFLLPHSTNKECVRAPHTGVASVRIVEDTFRQLVRAAEMTHRIAYEHGGFYISFEAGECWLTIKNVDYDDDSAEVRLPIVQGRIRCGWLLDQIEALRQSSGWVAVTDDCIRAHDEVYVIGAEEHDDRVMTAVRSFCELMETKVWSGLYSTSLVRALKDVNSDRLHDDVRAKLAELKLRDATDTPVYTVLSMLHKEMDTFNRAYGG